MGECRNCGKKGFFLTVDANGLCSICRQIVIPQVLQQGRIIKESTDLVERGKTLKTRLGRCDLIVERAQMLVEYEKKGIPTNCHAPSPG